MKRVLHIGHWCWDHVWDVSGAIAADEIYLTDELPVLLGGSVNAAVACADAGEVDVTTVLPVASPDSVDRLRSRLASRGVRLVPTTVGGADPWTLVLNFASGARTAFAVSANNSRPMSYPLDAFRRTADDRDVILYGYPCLTPGFDWAAYAGELAGPAVRVHAIDLNGIRDGQRPVAVRFPDVPVLVKGSSAEWCRWSAGADPVHGCLDAVRRGAALAVATNGPRPPELVVAAGQAWSRMLGRDVRVVGDAGSPDPSIVTILDADWTDGELVPPPASTVGAGDAFLSGCVLALVDQVRQGLIDPVELAAHGHRRALDWLTGIRQPADPG